MGLEIREITSKERAIYSALIDASFGLLAPLSYLDDFPVWDPEVPNQWCRYQIGAWSEGTFVGTASLRIVNYQPSTGEAIHLGLIGAVATHPSFQGKGIASQLLEKIINEGERKKVNLFSLWGSESHLYKNKGFEFAGLQIRSPLNKIKLEGPTLKHFEIREGLSDSVFSFFLSRKYGVLYDPEDLLWMKKQKNVIWRSVWVDGEIEAYCAWNRGIDLPNMIHELGGSEEGRRTLLEAVSVSHPHLELMHHPCLEKRGIISSAPIEFLAQFRLGVESERVPGLIGEIWLSGMDSC